MDLSWRHRLLGARALGRAGVGAIALLALFLADRGCTPSARSPESAVRAFIAASRAGDRQAAWELLGPRTRDRFNQAAEEATDRVGGASRYRPLELFEVGSPEGKYAPVTVIVRERKGAHAFVDILGPAGRRDTLEVVKVGAHWRVELPL